MKAKYLFPVLAGLAMVSCQEDDFLSTNVQSEQASPITFTVTKEDGAATKAWEDFTGRTHFNFGEGDLISLWNGMTLGKEGNDEVTWENATKWTAIGQNAVYEGYGEGESLVFTTRSIVNAGPAIMVYPADLTFYNLNEKSANDGLFYKLETAQTKETKNKIPYVSDVMNIGEYTDKGTDNTAGYARNYNVLLRPAGSLFGMKLNGVGGLNYEAIGVEPLQYTKVTMTNGEKGLFTNEIKITYSQTASALKDDASEKFEHILKQSDVAQAEDAAVASISTEDIDGVNLIDNLPVAYFSLLPMAESASADDAVSIEVQTTYGKVTVANNASAADGDKGPLQNKAETQGKNLKDNLDNVISNIYKATENSKFGEEKQGRVIRRTLTFDISNLDMDGLHIIDENHLMDALTVYDKIYGDKSAEEKAVTWILDGNENGEFVMNPEAAAEFEARLANENNRISFRRNTADDEKACTTVKFVATEETEVPAVIKFVGESATVQSADKVSIVFEGPWKYTNEKKEYSALTGMTFNGTLKLSGKVGATMTNSKDFTIYSNNTVTVDGTVDLSLPMVNYGTINIGEDDQLFVAGGSKNGDNDIIAVLTNDATALNKYGEINNAGSLGVRQQGKGTINNYGYIEQMNEEAYTYVTTNAVEDDGKAFEAAFNATNSKIGTIKLYGTGNMNTTVGNNNGFIKVYTDVETVDDEAVGTVANYVVITGACSKYAVASEKIKYVDVQSSKRVVFGNNALNGKGQYTLTGLVIGEGYSINIPSTVKVEVSGATYLKGFVYYAGIFTCETYNTYLGNTSNNNVIYQGATE